MTPEEFDRLEAEREAARLAKAAATPTHARVIRSAAGRSWCGSPGRRVTTENRTLCGGEMSDRDLGLRRDGTLPKSHAPSLTCPACRSALGLEALDRAFPQKGAK